MRTSPILLALPLLAACGGGSSAASRVSLYDQHFAAGPTHQVPALAGTVACFGGPIGHNGHTVELYVRRGGDEAGGNFAEDLVMLTGADAPMRFLISMAFDSHGPIAEASGQLEGQALVAAVGNTVSQIFDVVEHGNRMYLREFVLPASGDKPERVEVDAVGDTPAKMDAAGLGIPTDDDGWRTLSLSGGERNRDLAVQLHGTLPLIEAARCADLFAHFPPAAAAR